MSSAPSITLPDTLASIGRAVAVGYLRSYFLPVGATSGYTGSRFDRLGGGGDRPAVADEFTPEDLVAVTLVSVKVPGRAALEVLEHQRSELRELLRQIPTDLDLVDVGPAAIVLDWVPWRLETALRAIDGLGATTVSNLIARKRPRLVPVYDSVVEVLLAPVGGYWRALNCALRADDRALHRHLIALREESEIGRDISLLRVFDVVAWRTGKDLLASKTPGTVNIDPAGAEE